jgi:ureidoacrylate peracid hydrolase
MMLTTLIEKLSPDHTAMMVVDVQNDTCHEDGFAGTLGSGVGAKQAMIPRLEELIGSAREAGVHLIFVRHENSEDTDSEIMRERHHRIYGGQAKPVNLKGAWGADYYRVGPLPGDTEVVKHRYSAFYESDLDLILRSRGIRTLVVTGVSANICVEATAKDAFMRGYYAVVPEDCTASQTPEAQASGMKNIAALAGVVILSEEIRSIWGH